MRGEKCTEKKVSNDGKQEPSKRLDTAKTARNLKKISSQFANDQMKVAL